ncbi:MAG: ABC transporter ATP-binding protein [Candidatus Velthaea sp.]
MSAAVRFEAVTLWRRTQEEFSYDLKRQIFRFLQRRYRRPSRRKTIDNVSLEIGKGEKVGIIGPNGSGKSTLLKLACGVLRPTAGLISVTGRVAALIELGAGFDAELTVVENIMYYGVLLGFRRDVMRERIAGILDFAELTGHAHVPLKALSSGMTARLSFAIATDIRPEILFVDEVFSVGDEAFRIKSAQRMQRFWDEHSTIVLVSHDLPFIVSNCQRAVWLEDGRIRAAGAPTQIVEAYLADVAESGRLPRLAPGIPLDDAPALGHVDRLDLSGTRLRLDGWALLNDGSRAGSRVTVFVDGIRLVDAYYDVERPDVTDVFPQARGSTSGFRVDCDVSMLTPGVHRIDCALFDERSGRYFAFDRSHHLNVAAGVAALAR